MNILMIIIAFLVATAMPFSATSGLDWNEETPATALSGFAAYYSQGTMERTAVVRGYIERTGDYEKWLSDNGYLGAVAAYRGGDKLRDVHILWPNGIIDGPYLAIDVVARHHYELGLRKNRVIDVDYPTAMHHGMLGPVPVTIIYDYSTVFEMLYNTDSELYIKGCFITDEQGNIEVYDRCVRYSAKAKERYRPWH